MHNGIRIAVIAAVLILFSLFLLNQHLRDIEELYRVRLYMQTWLGAHQPDLFRGGGDGDGIYHAACGAFCE